MLRRMPTETSFWPTHNAAPEMTVQEGVPQGTVSTSPWSRRTARFIPASRAKPILSARRIPPTLPKWWSPPAIPLPTPPSGGLCPQTIRPRHGRAVYRRGGRTRPALFTALDNLIAQHRVPVMIAISIGNGSGDAQGSERGLEYDTMSGLYAEFVEKEVLPLVEKQYNVKLTKDPEGRATMGGSSGGSCALIMAWYHPELYHRVLTYSGTYVNQQWPSNPQTPHGAWEFHEHLIPNNPASHCESGWKWATGTISIRISCATICTIGWSPMRTWPKCWLPRAITISLFLPVTPVTRTARVKQQTFPRLWNTSWQGYPVEGTKN